MWYTREHHVGTLLCAEVCAALLQNVLVCVCVRARGVAMATTLRRCVCTGTCHARAGKPVRFHNSFVGRV